MKETQTKQLLEYLKTHDNITPLDALNLFGIFRLSGRIYDLRHLGIEIRSETVSKNGKHFAMYSLENK